MDELQPLFNLKTVQNLEQLQRVWAFAAPILALPRGKHTLDFYAEQLAQTPQLLVFAERAGQVCGYVLTCLEEDHVLIGAVAVADDSRRMGVGAAMMGTVENQAKEMGQNTLILGSLEDAETFYLACGFEANLFIQLPELAAIERLKALSEGYAVVWEAEQDGYSKLMLRTPLINKPLQHRYEQAFPGCYTQYVFIKHI